MKTPQQSYPELALAIGVPELYLKREDLHKYVSHKGRSIPLMIKRYAKDGVREFVISSSGNAAIAAVHSATAHNQNNPGHKVNLTVFIGRKIDGKKLNTLNKLIASCEPRIDIIQTDRPKQTAFTAEKESGGLVKLLRQSTDDLALEGYAELATELTKIPNLSAVFVPTSSGTTAQALAQTFLDIKNPVQVHIVQTAACHPIADAFQSTLSKTDANESIAGAIVDKVAHRKVALVELLKKNGGNGWITGNEEIMDAMGLVSQLAHLSISPNSALSISGLQKAVASGWQFTGPVACLITGP